MALNFAYSPLLFSSNSHPGPKLQSCLHCVLFGNQNIPGSYGDKVYVLGMYFWQKSRDLSVFATRNFLFRFLLDTHRAYAETKKFG